MEHWGFWDWLAYVALWVTAVIEAAEVALSRAHKIRRQLPALLKHPNWSLVPLGLLTLSGVVFLARLTVVPFQGEPHTVEALRANVDGTPTAPVVAAASSPTQSKSRGASQTVEPQSPDSLRGVIITRESLRDMTNEDLRAEIYGLSEKLNIFVAAYSAIWWYVDEDKNYDEAKKASEKLRIDENINRDFRNKFRNKYRDTVVNVYDELAHRLPKNRDFININKEYVTKIGIIDKSDISIAADRMIFFAKKLP